MPVNLYSMADEIDTHLLERLASAVTRIEAAIPVSAPHPVADQALQSRHEALCAEVRETVAAFDQVIANAQAGAN